MFTSYSAEMDGFRNLHNRVKTLKRNDKKYVYMQKPNGVLILKVENFHFSFIKKVFPKIGF